MTCPNCAGFGNNLEIADSKGWVVQGGFINCNVCLPFIYPSQDPERIKKLKKAVEEAERK